MAEKVNGAITKGAWELHTPLNAVTATTTSTAIPVAGAKKITWMFNRADHASGSTAFDVDVSLDGVTFVDWNLLISNATNTNAQNLTRVGSVTLSSDTTEIYAMDLEHFGVKEIKVTATETTDGTHTAKCLIEY